MNFNPSLCTRLFSPKDGDEEWSEFQSLGGNNFLDSVFFFISEQLFRWRAFDLNNAAVSIHFQDKGNVTFLTSELRHTLKISPEEWNR